MQTVCRILPAQERDIPEILSILCACGDVFPPLSQNEFVHVLFRNIRRSSALLAVQDARTAGVCVWSPVLRRISLLAVRKEARGAGLASALLGEALRCLPPGDVTVETFRSGDSRGEAALALYRKFGFQPAGFINGFEVPMQRLRLYRN